MSAVDDLLPRALFYRLFNRDWLP